MYIYQFHCSSRYRTPHLFAAILERHRASVKVGSYFWDELHFYTDIIDAMLGWLNRAVDGPPSAAVGVASASQWRSRTTSGVAPDGDFTSGGSGLMGTGLWGLLHSYGYLMGAIGYLGAEQSLCSVFHSVVCFSHRETFYYANFSFSAEALFRLYRQSYSGAWLARRELPDGVVNWRTAAHRSFFPELQSCRQDILADMDYVRIRAEYYTYAPNCVGMLNANQKSKQTPWRW